MRRFIVGLVATLLIVAILSFLDFRETVRELSAIVKLKLLELGLRVRHARQYWQRMTPRLIFAAVLSASACLSIIHIKASGERIDHGVVSRKFVTNAGVQSIVNGYLGTFTMTTMNFHANGTGTTAEAVGDTALVTEVETRVSGAQSSPSNGQYRSVGTVAMTATRAITEHGLFSQLATGGTLLDRSVFTAVNVVSGDSIQYTYTITFSAGG